MQHAAESFSIEKDLSRLPQKKNSSSFSKYTGCRTQRSNLTFLPLYLIKPRIMGKLTVYLDKVTNLIDRDLIGKSDPFVNFQLEQDNWTIDKNFGKKNSSVIKDNCDPVYGETFVWENVPSLKNLTLWVKVMDDDPIKNDKLGKCKIMIEELGVSKTPLGIDRVVDRNVFSKNARIFLKISWEE